MSWPRQGRGYFELRTKTFLVALASDWWDLFSSTRLICFFMLHSRCILPVFAASVFVPEFFIFNIAIFVAGLGWRLFTGCGKSILNCPFAYKEIKLEYFSLLYALNTHYAYRPYTGTRKVPARPSYCLSVCHVWLTLLLRYTIECLCALCPGDPGVTYFVIITRLS